MEKAKILVYPVLVLTQSLVKFLKVNTDKLNISIKAFA